MHYPDKSLKFSFIIPVFNRPDEIQELLESIILQTEKDFEVIVVEDGSNIKCDKIISHYSDKLNISYFFKENSGPGDSRNYGMRNAKGNYFLILDSDCILPPEYMKEVKKSLSQEYVDCFGGVDAALDIFTDIQKAINFAMTSVLTTGGVRGASEKLGKFQPRSFNMGISKKAFEASGGYSEIHPGEDPDLSIRLWKMGFETRLFQNVFVYHKRRIDWEKFKTQVNKFGMVRPILNKWYPEYAKLTYFFPSVFLIGFIVSLIGLIIGWSQLFYLYLFYFLTCLIMSTIQNKSIKVGILSLLAVAIQFYGYGTGFIHSFYKIQICNKSPKEVFPKLFFLKK